MKLLIVAAIKEDTDKVSAILKKSSIPVFSVTDTMGIKNAVDTDLLTDWFSRGVGKFDSVFIFCFTSEVNTEAALKEIELYNKEQTSNFPIRAFVLAVEKSLYN
jgi:hydrogenase maturation factor